MPAGGRAKIDAAKALPIVEDVLLAARDELAAGGLLGDPPTSSRYFVYRLLARDAVESLIRTGVAEARRPYAAMEQAWHAGKSGGKDAMHLPGTFSRWVERLHRDADPLDASRRCFAAGSNDGVYDVTLRIVRPRDDDGHGAAGLSVEISRDDAPVDVTPNPRRELRPRDAFFVDDAVQDVEHERTIESILVSLEQTLRVQPRKLLQRLRTDPSAISWKDQANFWTRFSTIARRLSQAVASVALLFFVAYCAAPSSTQAQVRASAKKLVRVFWCPGCEDPDRSFRWDFERPDLYYTPPSVSLDGFSATLGIIPAGAARSDTRSGVQIETRVISADGLTVQVRIEPPPTLRQNDTKHYINYGDTPKRTGEMNHLVTLGPAAVFEHRYSSAGLFPLRVGVARFSGADLEEHPSLPPTEGRGWVVVGVVNATIEVRSR